MRPSQHAKLKFSVKRHRETPYAPNPKRIIVCVWMSVWRAGRQHYNIMFSPRQLSGQLFNCHRDATMSRGENFSNNNDFHVGNYNTSLVTIMPQLQVQQHVVVQPRIMYRHW